MKTEIAVFGGGCFWCTEAIYQELEGVVSVKSGYAGGNVPNPTYEAVCTEKTGHAEVIQVEFNPEKIAYQQLLEIFFGTHDPTTPNRQGHDIGTEYRSIILYSSEEQKKEAETFIKELKKNDLKNETLITELKPLDTFYPAEEYHQNYYRNNTLQPYCQLVVHPKLSQFRQKYAAYLKPQNARPKGNSTVQGQASPFRVP